MIYAVILGYFIFMAVMALVGLVASVGKPRKPISVAFAVYLVFNILFNLGLDIIMFHGTR